MAVEVYIKTIDTDEERKLYEAFDETHEKYLKDHEQLESLVEAGKTDAAAQFLLGPSLQDFLKALEDLGKISQFRQTGGNRAVEKSATTYSSSRLWVILVIFAAVTASLVVAIVISGKISKALREAVKASDLLAEGVLSDEVKISSRDEVGQLIASMNRMTAYL